MSQTPFAILAGLLAGAAGALIVTFAGPAPRTGARSAPAADLSALAERLDRIEAALDRDAPPAPGALEGRGAPAPAPDARTARLGDALEERLAALVRENVRQSVKEAIEEHGTAQGAEPEAPAPRRVSLAEAAAELELTADEEDAVRRISGETTEAFLELLTDETHTLDDVRREFEDAKADPAKRAHLAGKYMTKVLGNMWRVLGLVVEHQRKLDAAIGAKRRQRLEREFRVAELDPYGLQDLFHMA